jgi:hypothetical protein
MRPPRARAALQLTQLEQFKPRFQEFGEGGFNEIIDLCFA